jgi:hypothetical protein
MHWDCESQGCFNKVKRPKIEVFADCFPGSIALGDMDGIVEINHCFLILEFKGIGTALPTGQRILFERLSKDKGFYILLIHGDAATMGVVSLSEFWDGKQTTWKVATLDDVKARIRAWVAFAQGGNEHVSEGV